MYPNLNPEDIEKVKELAETMQRNNDVAWAVSDYLNKNPRLITKERMEDVDPEGTLPEEAVFYALLTAFCGLDIEHLERDKQMAYHYLRKAIKKLDAGSYHQDPFYQNIRIPEKRFGAWELAYDKYEPYEAFIYNDLILDAGFKEIPRIGFFNEEFHFPVVRENGHEWMAVKPNEIETMKPALDLVGGDVVVFGLGIGYFAYMASLKATVSSVLVVERDLQAVQLFEHEILPQFQHREKIKVISTDAFEYVRKQMPEEDFDYAFVDLWHDISDGVDLYLKMKKLERSSPRTKFLYWIEDLLLSAFRWRVFNGIAANASSYQEVVNYLSKPLLQKLAATVR